MKTIVLLDDIFFEKLGDDYILQSKHSERYCLINSDAHSMISMLPQMTDTEKDELYRSNIDFWDTLAANGLALVEDCMS